MVPISVGYCSSECLQYLRVNVDCKKYIQISKETVYVTLYIIQSPYSQQDMFFYFLNDS